MLRLEGFWTSSLLFFGVLGLTQLPNSIDRPSNIELSTTGLTVQHWLRSYTPSNSIVLSSFETAPIVWLSEREWQEYQVHGRQTSVFQVYKSPIVLYTELFGLLTITLGTVSVLKKNTMNQKPIFTPNSNPISFSISVVN